MLDLILNPETLTVHQFMVEKSFRMRIPRYQRSYAWETEQVDDLLNDIDSAINRNASNYFIGTMLCVEREDKTLEIVDGQQRLTTLSLIFSVVLHRIKDSTSPTLHGRLGMHPDRFGERLSQFLYHGGGLFDDDVSLADRPYRLEVSARDSMAFRQIIQNGPSTQKSLRHRGLNDAYRIIKEFFEGKISESANGEKYLKQFVEFLATKVLVVGIFISDEANAYEIFEVLNARNMHLSAVDLIKNKLLSCFGGDGRKLDEAHEYWQTAFTACKQRPGQMQEYIRCHLQMRAGEKVDPKLLYRNLRDMLGEKDKATKAGDFLREAHGHCHEFSAVMCKDERFWDEFPDGIKPIVGYLNDYRVTYTLMLSMLYGKKPPDFVFGAYRLLSVFMKRTLAVRDRFSMLEKYEEHFASLARKFAHKKGPGTVDAFFTEIKRIDADCLQIVPDQIFINELANRQRIKGNNAKAILVELANHLQRQQQMATQVDLGTVTLEHVLPEKAKLTEWPAFGDEDKASLYLDRLGNLALLESRSNTGASNRKFAVKKKAAYAPDKCGIALTNELCDFTDWSPDDVKKRQLRLAELAAEVWKFKP